VISARKSLVRYRDLNVKAYNTTNTITVAIANNKDRDIIHASLVYNPSTQIHRLRHPPRVPVHKPQHLLRDALVPAEFDGEWEAGCDAWVVLSKVVVGWAIIGR
jgi:hypothetical protein